MKKPVKKEQTEYEIYLQSEHWKTLKNLVRDFYKNKCAVCNSDKNLNVHHRTYENKGKEQLQDLILLCKDCHSKFHNKMEKEPETEPTEQNLIPNLELDLIEILVRGDYETRKYLERNLNLSYIENEDVRKIVSMIFDRENYVNDFQTETFLVLLTNPKHREIVNLSLNKKNNLSVEHPLSIHRKPLDYVRFAKDVLRELDIKKLESEIEKMKDPEYLDKIRELKKSIMAMEMEKHKGESPF